MSRTHVLDTPFPSALPTLRAGAERDVESLREPGEQLFAGLLFAFNVMVFTRGRSVYSLASDSHARLRRCALDPASLRTAIDEVQGTIAKLSKRAPMSLPLEALLTELEPS
jgi:hypothetical protein